MKYRLLKEAALHSLMEEDGFEPSAEDEELGWQNFVLTAVPYIMSVLKAGKENDPSVQKSLNGCLRLLNKAGIHRDMNGMFNLARGMAEKYGDHPNRDQFFLDHPTYKDAPDKIRQQDAMY